jgi:hypothetical protein
MLNGNGPETLTEVLSDATGLATIRATPNWTMGSWPCEPELQYTCWKLLMKRQPNHVAAQSVMRYLRLPLDKSCFGAP